MKKNKVYFLPYAGGSSITYYSWYSLFKDSIQPIGLELAGRGKRLSEPFYKTVKQAVEDIMEDIKKELNGENYVIFGHSMGAVLAFELYYKIEEMGLQLPKSIFFSGRPSPNCAYNKINVETYDDETFLKLVSFYGGLPKEIDDPIVREIFLPILRADFQMIDEYVYEKKAKKIQSDIVVLWGKRDFSVPKEEAERWEDFAGQSFEMFSYQEGHFFINNHNTEIVNLITSQINKQS